MAERSLVSYLVLPRPDEAVMKAPLLLLAYGLARVAGPPGPGAGAWVLAAWAAFELGLYQARYMLNDLADADVDRMHRGAEARARLPSGPGSRPWAITVLVARLAAAGVLIAVLPRSARPATLVAALGLAAATVAYEAARGPMRRPGAGPAPAGPVFALVGAGYAARIGLGAALGGTSGWALGAAVGFGWVFGTLVVVMTWMLEAGGLTAAGDRAVLARKAHLAALAELIGAEPRSLAQPLRRGRAARLVTAMAAATLAAAVVLGVALGGWLAPLLLVATVVGVVVVARPFTPELLGLPKPAVGGSVEQESALDEATTGPAHDPGPPWLAGPGQVGVAGLEPDPAEVPGQQAVGERLIAVDRGARQRGAQATEGRQPDEGLAGRRHRVHHEVPRVGGRGQREAGVGDEGQPADPAVRHHGG